MLDLPINCPLCHQAWTNKLFCEPCQLFFNSDEHSRKRDVAIYYKTFSTTKHFTSIQEWMDTWQSNVSHHCNPHILWYLTGNDDTNEVWVRHNGPEIDVLPFDITWERLQKLLVFS